MKIALKLHKKIKHRLFSRIGMEIRLAHRVLDIGCGDCELACYLARTYDQKIVGIDITSESFPKYQDLGRIHRNIKCIRKDALDIEFLYKAIDAVVMMMSLCKMEQPLTVLQQAYQSLEPGGEIVIVDYFNGSSDQKSLNEHCCEEKEIVEFLSKAGFEDIQKKLLEHKQILWITAHRAPATMKIVNT